MLKQFRDMDQALLRKLAVAASGGVLAVTLGLAGCMSQAPEATETQTAATESDSAKVSSRSDSDSPSVSDVVKSQAGKTGVDVPDGAEVHEAPKPTEDNAPAQEPQEELFAQDEAAVAQEAADTQAGGSEAEAEAAAADQGGEGADAGGEVVAQGEVVSEGGGEPSGESSIAPVDSGGDVSLSTTVTETTPAPGEVVEAPAPAESSGGQAPAQEPQEINSPAASGGMGGSTGGSVASGSGGSISGSISSGAPIQVTEEVVEEAFVEPVAPAGGGETQVAQETQALEASTPAMPVNFQVEASGVAQEANERATIDYSNAADGYAMVNYTQATPNRVKVLVDGPTTQYQYTIAPGEWTAIPFSDGSGTYRIGVYENVSGSSYAEAMTAYINVTLRNEYSPFLRSNQYVNIMAAPQMVAKAQEICGSEPVALKKVQLVYEYVVNHFSYDVEKAKNIQTGYLPNLDSVLNAKTGICFDYAALMTGMLRSQGVPCKLVVGYAGDVYHAWIDVWSQDNGWVSGAIYFDGNAWQRMDPTFASSSKQSQAIMQYIGDGQNYSSKYFY